MSADLSHTQTASQSRLVKSLLNIWDEEQARRKQQGLSTQFTPDYSQARHVPTQTPPEAALWHDRLREIVKEESVAQQQKQEELQQQQILQQQQQQQQRQNAPPEELSQYLPAASQDRGSSIPWSPFHSSAMAAAAALASSPQRPGTLFRPIALRQPDGPLFEPNVDEHLAVYTQRETDAEEALLRSQHEAARGDEDEAPPSEDEDDADLIDFLAGIAGDDVIDMGGRIAQQDGADDEQQQQRRPSKQQRPTKRRRREEKKGSTDVSPPLSPTAESRMRDFEMALLLARHKSRGADELLESVSDEPFHFGVSSSWSPKHVQSDTFDEPFAALSPGPPRPLSPSLPHASPAVPFAVSDTPDEHHPPSDEHAFPSNEHAFPSNEHAFPSNEQPRTDVPADETPQRTPQSQSAHAGSAVSLVGSGSVSSAAAASLPRPFKFPFRFHARPPSRAHVMSTMAPSVLYTSPFYGKCVARLCYTPTDTLLCQAERRSFAARRSVRPHV